MSTASVALGRPSTPSRKWRNARATTFLSAAFFAAFTDSTHAQTSTDWHGSFSEDWFNANNWYSGVPTQTTSANLNAVNPFATVVEAQAAAAQNLVIGVSGTGMLTIRGGGTLTTSFTAIGNNKGSSGTVMVTGAGSSLTTDNSILVGGAGTGTLTVENGATLNTFGGGTLGQSFGSTGTVVSDRGGLHLEQRTRRRAQYR